jgi:uncharacterized protein
MRLHSDSSYVGMTKQHSNYFLDGKKSFFMKNVLIAGGTGLVGNRLSQILRDRGYTVFHLSRRENLQAEFPAYAWDIAKQTIDIRAIEKADFIINLAGSGIADKRWSNARKKDIIDSRVQSALLLKHTLEKTNHPIKAYLSASAIGFYGDRGNEFLLETANKGTGFLTESTVEWENAVAEVGKTGIRIVALRIGIVMSTKGGALQKMLMSFLFRLGVYFGDGKQWYSWIHIDDLCLMFAWAIGNERAHGFYNAVSPNPLSNYDLTKAISTAKGGAYVLMPAPAFALRLVMGELADAVLNSSKVSTQKIENEGFKFQFPEAVAAFKDLFQRKI